MSGHDAKYFTTTKKGEIHELKEELHSQYKVSSLALPPFSLSPTLLLGQPAHFGTSFVNDGQLSARIALPHGGLGRDLSRLDANPHCPSALPLPLISCVLTLSNPFLTFVLTYLRIFYFVL
jgi:hypothetical protein